MSFARLFGRLGLGLATVMLPLAAHAAWPERPIHLVVPFPPGSSPDLLARTIAEPLSQVLQQSIVVDNKPGAGGNIGTRIVSQAKPDGYTLLYTINGPLVTAPTLYKRTLGYDPLKDLAPITLVATSPNVLTVPANLGADNLQDFVKLAKERAGALNYGSVGPGSSAHLAMEMFKQEAKIDLAQIPYPGFPQVISAIIGGDVQAGFMVPAIAMPQVKDGRVKALAITSLEPSDALPGIPTMASQGYPGFEAISWNAILAPAGTPTPIVERLNSELARIIDSEAVRKQLLLQYFTPAPSTPEALTQRIRDEKARWDRVIESLNLSLD
ncbi:Bug family tripartite tricarboxylate transporter substrate binding protein [Bordetella hinzii]|uniref:Tripartite tricarboxylate transporter family receptor n=1 Tax=Bordetella hinzii OH87 BAL007II TaxID=1331262 RepID=A0ABR4QUU9_9BORD|nr:tripartite tricarboxylate transporter substrate binding protein [Bordetella hinzii]AKQ53650.1 Tripartite tricarboxylate transporter family receptor [Bordetella hinzii]KCB21850.1 tripartite tricarboxylate transporter family receptor [Bordetella hinzii OH87 BAL007II]KCB26622.1 tripartite tricarboxylate transporter family receptor [Bordetella hinzii L60]KCB39707.1 tripartite tricarboxylate transporter family receptor [Bordetella hinzii 5132]KCB43444.1 tripartite tricarboxylate transporter fami